jgi:hypothetical protein
MHAAPSNDDKEETPGQEPGADPSDRASKKQRTEASDEEAAAMHAPSSCKSFYLHEISLVSSSKYFRTLLETSVGGLETEMSTVGRSRTIVILHDYVEEGEMEAVELVLKSFYDKGKPPLNTLPSAIDAKVPLLLKAMMVAERYQADRCEEKIAEALSSIPASDLSFEVIKQAFELPATLYDMPLLNGFRYAAIHCFIRGLGTFLRSSSPMIFIQSSSTFHSVQSWP